VSSNAGLYIGSVFFTDDDSLASIVYKTVTITAINGDSITLSDAPTRTTTGFTGASFYLPVSDPAWSNPSNEPFSNYGGHRFVVQYAGDNTLWGSNIDTMIDNRNNIFYWTIGAQGVYDRNRYKRSANIYIPLGSARFASALAGTLNYRGTGEIQSNGSNMFVDTSNTIPDYWDLHLKAGSPAIGAGVPISGFTKDFGGNTLTNPPSIGLYNYATPSPAINSFRVRKRFVPAQ